MQSSATSTSSPTLEKTYLVTTRKGGPTREGVINFVEEKPKHARKPFGWRHLFRKPVIRQYLQDGHIWRERSEREPSRFELFFDLIFVGIIHQLADGATEEFTTQNVAKFIILFFPSWSIWQDTRTFINHSGTDDIPQRLFILLTMALLVGYSANASAITLPSQNNDPSSPPFATLRAAVLFFLVARFIRMLYSLIYAFCLPKFRKSMTFAALGIAVQSAFYFPLIWVRSESVVWTLTAVGMGASMTLTYTIGIMIELSRWHGGLKRQATGTLTPAYNIEHHIERTSQFIIIVLGEAVLNITYKAVAPEIGVNQEFGRAIMGLMCAYFLCWLYFNQEISHTYVHALRRHWFSALSSNILHFPLSCGIILWSATLQDVVQADEVEQPVRWYFSGGLAAALLSLSLLAWMHKNLDAPGSSLIPHHIGILVRVFCAIVLACLPLSDSLRDTNRNLGVHVSILVCLAIIETVGKIGTLPLFDEASDGVVEVPQGREGESEEEAIEAEMVTHDGADLVRDDGDEESQPKMVALTKRQCLAFSCNNF